MSLDGVIDAPDIVQEAKPYILSSEEHISYQKSRLYAADTLLLGRKTYEKLSKAYVDMANAGQGAPMDIVERMNRAPSGRDGTAVNNRFKRCRKSPCEQGHWRDYCGGDLFPATKLRMVNAEESTSAFVCNGNPGGRTFAAVDSTALMNPARSASVRASPQEE